MWIWCKEAFWIAIAASALVLIFAETVAWTSLLIVFGGMFFFVLLVIYYGERKP